MIRGLTYASEVIDWGGVRIGVALITPAIAETILEGNTLNRPVKYHHLQRMISSMVKDKYLFNAMPVLLGVGNVVLDAQHRLLSVIKSGRPQYMVVVENLPKEVFTTIDRNCVRRTPGDIFAIARFPKAHPAARLVRTVTSYLYGTPGFSSSTCWSIPDADQLQFAAKYQLADFCIYRQRTNDWVTDSTINTMAFLTSFHLGKEVACKWWMEFVEGENLDDTDCRLALRNLMVNTCLKGEKMKPPVQLYTAIKAFNFSVAGENRLKLKPVHKSRFPRTRCYGVNPVQLMIDLGLSEEERAKTSAYMGGRNADSVSTS